MINQEFRRKSAINHQLEKGHLNFHCRNVKSGFDKEKLIMKRCIKGGFSVLSGVVGVVLLSSKMGFYCVTKCRQKSREPTTLPKIINSLLLLSPICQR